MRLSGMRTVGMVSSLCMVIVMQCDTVTDPQPPAFAFVPIPDQQSAIIDTNYHYATVAFTATATGPAIVTYSISNKPDGAQFDSSTGVFSWTPTIADFGTRGLVVSAAAGGDTVRDTVRIVVQTPSLGAGVVLKMVTPNGGETYNYGDTVTCMWLQDPTVVGNGMLKVNNGPLSCDYFADQTEYLRAGIDTAAAAVAEGMKYFLVASPTTYVAVCRIVLVDRPMTFSGCGARFGGSEMSFAAWDQYAPPGCGNCYDESDDVFTIVK